MKLIDLQPHLLTVAEYMTLEIDARTELLGGVIYDVSPKNEPHSHAISRLNRALTPGLPQEYEVRIQDPIAVNGWTGRDAPEIDVAVIAAGPYRHTPTAADSFAFVDVSDSTYRSDRRVKIPLYVAAGVPSWIVNIPMRQVEHYATPSDLALESGCVVDTISILGVSIRASDLFLI